MNRRHLENSGLVGFPEQVGTRVLNHPVIGCDADLAELRKKCAAAVLAIGQLPDPTTRQRLASRLDKLGFHYPVLVSPHAVVSRHARLGQGCTVGHGVIVNAAAEFGEHCILNSRALIEHDAQIGDYCHISTGVIINGGVRIGSGSFIGSGAILREGIELPNNTVIGSGKRIMGWPLLNQNT